MSKKFLFLTVFILALSIVLTSAKPASAFYLEVPRVLQNLWNQLRANRTSAQETGNVAPAPAASTNNNSATIQQPATNQPSQNEAVPQPLPIVEPQPPSTCRINGVEMPGSCDQYNNRSYGGLSTDNSGSNFAPNNQQPNEDHDQGNQNEEQNNERFLRDMRRGAAQMRSQFQRLESLINRAERGGTSIPAEIRSKMESVKSQIETLRSSDNVDDLQNMDMGSIQADLQELEEFRENTIEAARRMQDVRRGLRGMKQGVTMFERQVARIRGIRVPAEITEKITRAKTVIATVEAARTWDDMMNAGLEDMQTVMQDLDESRGQLEMLARWPDTKRQMDREMTRLNQALRRARAIATQLTRREVNVNNLVTEFSDGINRLKQVKDEATAKMQAGQSQEAFDQLENDFFGQMEDTWQKMRTIEMMSNLGRFNSQFRRGMTQMRNQINTLKRRRLDVSDLENLQSQINAKGQEVLELIRNLREIDEEAVMEAIEEMDRLGEEFENKKAELTGEENEDMPWEKGPSRFQRVEVPNVINRLMPARPNQGPNSNEAPDSNTGNGANGGPGGATNPVGESNPSPAP